MRCGMQRVARYTIHICLPPKIYFPKGAVWYIHVNDTCYGFVYSVCWDQSFISVWYTQICLCLWDDFDLLDERARGKKGGQERCQILTRINKLHEIWSDEISWRSWPTRGNLCDSGLDLGLYLGWRGGWCKNIFISKSDPPSFNEHLEWSDLYLTRYLHRFTVFKSSQTALDRDETSSSQKLDENFIWNFIEMSWNFIRILILTTRCKLTSPVSAHCDYERWVVICVVDELLQPSSCCETPATPASIIVDPGVVCLAGYKHLLTPNHAYLIITNPVIYTIRSLAPHSYKHHSPSG